MTITLPSGQPNERFMRYVRPPVSEHEDHPPLFPLRPATRQLRLGIDVTTVPTPPDGLLTGYLTRDEIDVQLLLPEDQEVPSTWVTLLPAATTVRVGFTAVPETWPMMLAFSVGFTADSETRRTRGTAKFFPAYQLADAQAAPTNAQVLNSSQRHQAAAYAAVAAKVNIDVIVTNAPTAGRPDVADNDIVIAVTPDGAVALIGLHLRMTANPVVGVEQGALAGDAGSWETTLSTGTIENLYNWGLVSHMRYFEIFQLLATQEADSATVTALRSIRVRLTRAARALDHMLAALSNPLNNYREADVIETTAEAFDRELLYLAAAFDIYGRRYPLLIDPTRDPKNFRQSLDGKGYIKDHVEKEYDASLLVDVQRLHVYATVCKVLRNHIHDGILPVNQHLGRSYGNTFNIALNLDAMPELQPGSTAVDTRLTQAHYDSLGAWQADPADAFANPMKVADLATTGVTLLMSGLQLIEAFTKVILRNKPQTAAAPSPLLGSLIAAPGWTEPPLPERAVLYGALFGYHPV
ncbi:hypothetical protein H7J87_01495 [Mycolicibacterium wolinskyi]|uniref:hypothetical protein n=1 Tax=Mycolicibacterium TaxID=1866885 RepID=UPI001A99017D|nr:MULTISPECIES: hypothetical protein [Mycolicibacterium]MCV7283995.1 hypothetical protein [Mycolicibacterium wolinskyi]MCV7296151.1 hypothetical protein [Mycolicibacterium goodii]